MSAKSFDSEALNFAADLAADGVLPDPTDDEVVLAVEEFMYPNGWKAFSDRLQRGVLSVYNAVEGGEDRKVAIRRAKALWGLC